MFAMISYFFRMVKNIFLIILNLIRNIFCFWKKNSVKNHQSPSNDSTNYSGYERLSTQEANDQMSNWDSWDEDGPLEVVVGSASIGPTTVEEKIQAYRESIRTKKDDFAEEDQEPSAEELFADMAPTVIRQKKVYIGNTNSTTSASAQNSGDISVLRGRLLATENAYDPVLSQGATLDDWGSNPSGGWDVEDDDLGVAIRESRKMVPK